MKLVLVLLLWCATVDAADLWVYRESGIKCTRSDLLYEAMCEPMDSLRARLPDHETMRDYLADLEQARSDLQALGAVTVRTRDEAKLHWECPVPSYGLRDHEVPRLLRPEAYSHPVLIVRHLEYLSLIADAAAVAITDNTWDYGVSDRPCVNYWLAWQPLSVVTVNYGDLVQVEEIDVLVPKITPVPAVDAQCPVRVELKWRTSGTKRWDSAWLIRYTGGCHRAQLQAIDMGTGLIVNSP